MLFPEVGSSRVLVVSEDPSEELALAATLGDLDELRSVGAALPQAMTSALRIREPTVLLTLGATDLSHLPQPVVALVRPRGAGRHRRFTDRSPGGGRG
jgi:hypothetical protein